MPELIHNISDERTIDHLDRSMMKKHAIAGCTYMHVPTRRLKGNYIRGRSDREFISVNSTSELRVFMRCAIKIYSVLIMKRVIVRLPTQIPKPILYVNPFSHFVSHS